MDRLAELPNDLVFMTQITMEAADDTEFLEAMRRANVKGALVGVESVTPEGLKSVYKDFNSSGEDLVRRLQQFREHKVYILGSFIFGLSTDRPDTFDYTADIAHRAGVVFAQFLPLTPLPRHVGFRQLGRGGEEQGGESSRRSDKPLLADPPTSPSENVYAPPGHVGRRDHAAQHNVWDSFYRLPSIWERSKITKSIRGRLSFVLMSKLYRQMYAKTGFATDSARTRRARRWTQWIAKPVRRLFRAPPMPDLQVPRRGV